MTERKDGQTVRTGLTGKGMVELFEDVMHNPGRLLDLAPDGKRRNFVDELLRKGKVHGITREDRAAVCRILLGETDMNSLEGLEKELGTLVCSGEDEVCRVWQGVQDEFQRRTSPKNR